MNTGWIKLYRKIIEHPVYTSDDDRLFKFWLMILMDVNHKEQRIFINGGQVVVQRGQTLTSIQSLLDMYNGRGKKKRKKKYKISFQTCRTLLKHLETLDLIKQYPTNQYRIIEVVNYSKYQDIDSPNLTSDQQTTNKQLTTNKNIKNIKNIYKEYKFFDDYSFKKAYTDFKAMRKSMRNVPYTESAEKTILNKLHKVEIKTAVAMLEESTEKGWRSVFPPKSESDPMAIYNKPLPK